VSSLMGMIAMMLMVVLTYNNYYIFKKNTNCHNVTMSQCHINSC
jgi:hypothetical protein